MVYIAPSCVSAHHELTATRVARILAPITPASAVDQARRDPAAEFLSHKSQWLTEPSSTLADLPHMTSMEAAVYADLTGDVHGPKVLLEQERVRFSAIIR